MFVQLTLAEMDLSIPSGVHRVRKHSVQTQSNDSLTFYDILDKNISGMMGGGEMGVGGLHCWVVN